MNTRLDAQHRRRDAVPEHSAPVSSWWVGLDRAAFSTKLKDQQDRLHGIETKYHAPNLATARDGHRPVPSAFPGRSWEND